MPKIPRRLLELRERTTVMRPETFRRIEREAERRGARDPRAVAGAAYWRALRARARRTRRGHRRIRR